MSLEEIRTIFAFFPSGGRFEGLLEHQVPPKRRFVFDWAKQEKKKRLAAPFKNDWCVFQDMHHLADSESKVNSTEIFLRCPLAVFPFFLKVRAKFTPQIRRHFYLSRTNSIANMFASNSNFGPIPTKKPIFGPHLPWFYIPYRP